MIEVRRIIIIKLNLCIEKELRKMNKMYAGKELFVLGAPTSRIVGGQHIVQLRLILYTRKPCLPL